MGIVVRRRHTMAQPPDEFKIVVVGAGGVGKSGLTLQFCAGKCPKRYDPTIEDSYRKTTELDGRPVTLDILDTAGQEEYACLRAEYMTEGKGFVLVYSITDHGTFEEMNKFKEQIEENKKPGEKVPLCLVGNKIDLEDNPDNGRKVKKEEGEEKVKEWMANKSDKIGDIMFMETSALTKKNVDETFKGLVRLMGPGKKVANPQVSSAAPAAAQEEKETKNSGDKSGG